MFGTYYGVLHELLTLFHTRLFHGKWRLRIIIARNVIQLEIYNAIDLGEKRLKRLLKFIFRIPIKAIRESWSAGSLKERVFFNT